MGAGEGVNHRARAKKAKTPLAQIEAILDNPELEKLWPAKQIKQEKNRVRGERKRLFGRQPARISPFGAHVHGVCCSHRWAWDVWEDSVRYPPEDRHTPAVGEGGRGEGSGFRVQGSAMQVCPGCRALVPAIYMGSSGHCLDCRLEALPEWRAKLLQHSSSVIDYYQLRKERLKE